MARPSESLRKARVAAAALALGLAAAGGVWSAFRAMEPRPRYLELPRAAAVRRDLAPVLGNGGTLDTAEKTIVRCELEGDGVGPAMTRIIDLADDGAVVRKGDVIARLDASHAEEQVRQHEILLLQAQAAARKAELDLRSAEIALAEYRDGLLEQLRQDGRSQVVLHQANLRRQRDRLAWAERMVASRYLPRSQLVEERAVLEKSEVALRRAEGELRQLEAYTSVVQIKRLEAAVAAAVEELGFQRTQLGNREDQLARSRAQVEACTIRAPHDGMVNYVTKWDPNAQVEPGALAFQNMPLFYFPNLEKLEVVVELHESMFERVRPGQPVRVRVATRPGLLLTGRVASLDPLPAPPKAWWLSEEIRNFTMHVALVAPPPGLYPGMSASVEVLGDARHSALVVPSAAVTLDRGREVVYVAGARGLERRRVTVRPGDLNDLQVRSGLAEGEQVILAPHDLDPADLLAARDTEGPALDAAMADADAPQADGAL
jgi:RND family efflux transporter MFP subunit